MDKQRINKIILNIFEFLGWIWWMIKKPFVWFGKQNWKIKAIIIVFVLAIWDWLRFLIFDFFMWILI